MADTYNKNSGYGMHTASSLASKAQTSGKLFVVGATSLAGRQILQDIFDVDSGAINRYFQTLQAAANQAVANRGDVIFVMPGHTETFASSTAITLATAGIRIIGLGTGSQRPTFTLSTANTATINVTANSISIENCIFVANFLAIASCFTLTTADDFVLFNCVFRDTSSVLNFLGYVTTDTNNNDADGLVIDSCKFTQQSTSGAVFLAKPLATNDRWIIRNNNWLSLSTNAAAIIPIATGKVLTDATIVNNRFNLQNATGTATAYFITTNGSTNSGFIDGNQFHALPTTPLLVTASSGFVYGINYHADQPDTSGYILPAQDS